MLKQAVDTHNAIAAVKKPLAQQLFPSSSPPVSASPPRTYQQYTQRSGSRPLSAGSTNVVRPSAPSLSRISGTGSKQNGISRGIKRTSSGLAKTLGTQNDFEEPLYPVLNSQDDPIVVKDDSPSKRQNAAATAVEFDENDFESDVDLDIENPATKGAVTYPKLPPPPDPIQRPPVRPTRPMPATHVARQRGGTVDTQDSGYMSRDVTPAVGRPLRPAAPPPPSSSGVPIPWSSSPAEHYKSPPKASAIRQFTYSGPLQSSVSNGKSRVAEDKPRHTKRRTLPWLEREEPVKEEVEESGPPAAAAKPFSRPKNIDGSRGNFTPLPKDTKNSLYPWNTTASAIKAQQKNLREVNKKLSKTNPASEDVLQHIVNEQRTRVSRPFLSDEQQHVLDLVVEQKCSVFFTGSAGTGKSVLLREIIASLRKKYARESDRVAVTASTGLAACNVGGVTLHSFAGFGLGKEPVPELVKKIKRNQKAKHRWMRTKVLIIDEISMVDGDLFDKLEEIARIVRNNGRPFGGIQLIITGDFFQLPPVPEHGRMAKFAFDAATWNTSIEHTIGLHHVFRQKDPAFAEMLNEMREGRLSQKSINAFRALSRPVDWEDGFESTELFPTRSEVDAANNKRMASLVGETKIFEAKDGGSITDQAQRDKLLQNCMAPDTIHLKKGAQVMLIKNIDDTLVNGSLGKVIGFMSEAMFDSYHEHEDAFHAASEGRDEALNPAERKLKTKIELLGATAQTYPVVRFAIADGTTRDLLCQRETWKVELPNGEVQASRQQIPLILAWALSIHKAQGQTLERVKVDLGKVFEKGQAYVALSRATSMAGLQVLRFDPNKVVAHERVRNFYAGLTRAESTAGGTVGAAKGKGLKGKKSGVSVQSYETGFAEEEWLDEQEAMAAYG